MILQVAKRIANIRFDYLFYGREAERKKLHTMFHSDGQMILRQNTSQKFSKRSASSI